MHPPKVKPTEVEVEGVAEEDNDDDDTVPPLLNRNKPDSDSDSDSDDDDDDITPTAEGSYIKSRGLRCTNRERIQPTYTKVNGETGQRYVKE